MGGEKNLVIITARCPYAIFYLEIPGGKRDCRQQSILEPDCSAVPVWAVVTSPTHTILNQKKAHTTKTDAKREVTKMNAKARETLDNEAMD